MANDCEVTRVIDHGYCVGCGACAAIRPAVFSTLMDREGKKQAVVRSDPNLGDAVAADSVCPFSSAARDETEIARSLFSNTKYDEVLGYHDAIYAGHVTGDGFRERGSSGGGVSWLIAELFRLKLIDFVVHVGNSTKDEALFQYRISRNSDQALAESKSKYYPISLEEVIPAVLREPGRGLFVAIPCFAKTLRNLAKEIPELGERVEFVAGLVCGHLKTAQFSQNFAWQMGVRPQELEEIDFRHMEKHHSGAANHYFVRVVGESDGVRIEKVAQNKSLFGFLWGHGFFKYKSCDYCDDVFAETADISFGDAWIEPYVSDPMGDNLIIVRDTRLRTIIEDARRRGALMLDQISVDQARQTQSAGIRHRRDGIQVRVRYKHRIHRWTPIKRFSGSPFIGKSGFRQNLIFLFREFMSAQSRSLFAQAVGRQDYDYFHRRMNLIVQFYDKVLYFDARKIWNAVVRRI